MSRPKTSVLAASFAFTALAGGLAAVAEALGALPDGSSVDGGGGQFALVSASAFGLLAPVIVAIAIVVGVGGLFCSRVWARGLSGLSQDTAGGRALRVALPLQALATSFLLVLIGHLGLLCFQQGSSAEAVAISFALSLALVLRLGFGVALRLTESIALMTRWAPGRGMSIVLAIGLFLGPLAWGIQSGDTGGGGGFWGLLGVLKREGINYRVPAVLLGLSVAAWLPAVSARRRWTLGWPSVVLTASLLTAGAWGSAVVWLEDTTVSLPLERGHGFSSLAIALGRRLSDRDGDGVSALYGGGDCAASHPGIFPGALDVPGNGLDEDCSGRDALPPEFLPLKPKSASVANPIVAAPVATLNQQEWIAQRLPTDLNLIFLTIDTLRHDLGYMGYRRQTTKNLDKLAARSVVFERAYSLASYTGKSMGPMLIGRYTSETHRGWWHFNHFDERETFVQERLQTAGIRTLSVQGHWYFTPKYGLGRGFDVSDTSATPRKRQREGDRTVNSNRLTDAAIARLSDPANTSGQFFLWAHYLDPHAEYMRHPQFDFGRRGRDLYDSEVAFTDYHIGRLIDFVQASEFAERTAIVITSDHGESFGENKMWRHGNEVWETLVRVPLIVYVPGAEPRRHAMRRSAIDLAPTILELLGVPQPTGEARLSGESLVPDIFMPPGHVPEARPVFIDMSAGPYNQERQALIVDDQKLIVSAGRVLGLYNLAKDPKERRNLARKPERLVPMKEKLEKFRRRLRPVHVKPR